MTKIIANIKIIVIQLFDILFCSRLSPGWYLCARHLSFHAWQHHYPVSWIQTGTNTGNRCSAVGLHSGKILFNTLPMLCCWRVLLCYLIGYNYLKIFRRIPFLYAVVIVHINNYSLLFILLLALKMITKYLNLIKLRQTLKPRLVTCSFVQTDCCHRNSYCNKTQWKLIAKDSYNEKGCL